MIVSTEPRVWGYARRSSDKQALSPEAQRQRIHERAAQMGVSVDYIWEETESAKEVAWTEREVMLDVCNTAQNGDTLIVWQLKRIDRDFTRMLAAAEYFASHGVRLIILEFKGAELDYNDTMGKVFIRILATFAEMEQDFRIDAVKRGIKVIRDAGLRNGHHTAPLGMRWEWVEVPHELRTQRGETRRQRQVWDEQECNLIREAWIRHYHLGQSIAHIGRLYSKRKLKMPDGTPWVPTKIKHTIECRAARPPKSPKWGNKCYGPVPCPRYPEYRHIHLVIKRMDELIEKDAVPPQLKVTDALIAAFKKKILEEGD